MESSFGLSLGRCPKDWVSTGCIDGNRTPQLQDDSLYFDTNEVGNILTYVVDDRTIIYEYT